MGLRNSFEMDSATTLMPEDDKDEQNLKSDGVHGEEIYGNQLRHVIGQKCSPRL